MVTLAGRPAARLRVLILAVISAVLAALVAVGPARPAAAQAAAASDRWTLSTTAPGDAAGAPAYIGNGYVGTRVPADGAGYVEAPVATETHVAGVYADKPDVEHGGTQSQGSVSLPGWTQLDVIVAGRRYAAADASAYRQTLDLRRGVVTTTATWSVGGRATRLTYDVTLDRARERVGLVRLRLTPDWSGSLRVRDVLGAGADLTPEGLRPVRATADARNALLVVRTAGIGTRVAEGYSRPAIRTTLSPDPDQRGSSGPGHQDKRNTVPSSASMCGRCGWIMTVRAGAPASLGRSDHGV